MRRLVSRKRVRIADLSDDWGETRGLLARRPGEQPIDHLGRLASDPGRPLCVGTAATLLAYSKAFREGASMPPVFVVRGPRGYLLVDGSHRTKAAAFNGELDIDAVVVRARSEADADAIADAFWAAEFTDGYYPSDQAGWGVAAHIRLEAPPQRRPGPQVAGRTAALERRRLLVSQSLGKAA